ncbi:MAG: amidohydrolase [Cyclobacteriaceae bacterium]|nr:amidohydrolase [Cyclobacteriaceae bacterium]UYN88201.1 MAG: amidohydrolase [Cyclobacteriaceae bacterium]
MKKVTLYTWAMLTMLLVSNCGSGVGPADMVVLGGKIYTVNEAQPEVEAVAVNGDKIAFAGSEQDVQKYIGKNTRVVNLEGKTMFPGFIEGHGHFMGVGYNELNLDLMYVKSYDELIEKVKEAAGKAQPGQWILGRGWHQDKWDVKPEKMIKGFQTHHKLSEVSPNNPVFLRHASGHAAMANAKAMEVAGVNQLSKEIIQDIAEDGGEIIRDEWGNPTGIFNERAMGLISRFIPDDEEGRDAQALELAVKACWRNGITSFHDAGVTRENITLFKKFKEEGKLGVRLYAMLTGWDRDLVYEWFRKGPEIDAANLLTIRSVKLNCDGALGSRGAWLLEPYTDRPDFFGMATYPMDTVLVISRQALKSGFQVCSHAIGDRANQEILDRYEIALKENPSVKDHRFRIEHAQHLHPNDIPRFGKLGVIPAMQAIHMSSDRPWAIERLGEKRIKEGAYMWQSLLQSGAIIVNGTDAPVEPLNPIPSFYASVSRKTLKGEPEGGYEPEEKMTRAQALRSYTLDAAYGAFEEKIKGSIEKGKLADFVILSKDIMQCSEQDILKSEVSMTIFGGKVVYEKKN